MEVFAQQAVCILVSAALVVISLPLELPCYQDASTSPQLGIGFPVTKSLTIVSLFRPFLELVADRDFAAIVLRMALFWRVEQSRLAICSGDQCKPRNKYDYIFKREMGKEPFTCTSDAAADVGRALATISK